MTENQKKDIWDIIQILGGLVSSILIGGFVSYSIQIGSEHISNSLEAGKLTQSLVDQLSSVEKDKQLRQDIALAALDGSIGDHKPQLVAAIAERIATTKGVDKADAKFAVSILRRRDETTYNEVIKPRIEGVVQQAQKTAPESTPSAPPVTPGKSQSEISVASETISRTISGLIFIQFQSKREADANTLQSTLSKQGLEVPSPEKIDSNFSNSIRFFNAEDKELALRVKALIEAKEPNQKFEILDFSNSGFKAPIGQLEIWLGS